MPPRNNGDEDTGITARDLARLQHECPGATASERKRFLRAKDGNFSKALEQLKAYLAWRCEHGLNDMYHCSSKLLMWPYDAEDISDPDEDYDTWHPCAPDEATLDEYDWRFASQAALLYDEINQEHSKPLPSSKPSSPAPHTLPQLARILPPSPETPPLDKQGNRILQFLPARMDLSRASETAFALSIALYLERKLDRDSQETILVAIDVRGGHGWANPRPQKLLPFIKHVASLLEQNYPERLARCVLFPVPAAATILWRMVRVFLDPHTAEKIDFVRGDSRNAAPPPLAAMDKHVAPEVLGRLEDFRCASFAEKG